MTKRASPFETHICRQFKVHVNNYENDLTALKDIEEQTIKKLMNGSKNLNLNSFKFDQPMQESVNSHEKNKNYMQKYVTNYFTVNGKIISEKNNKIITCPEDLCRCFFCDQKTNSTYQCSQCSEFFCSACSFVNYESFEDNRICISCS